MIDYNHYYILDYYPDVQGQPLLLVVKKGGVPGKEHKKLKFPSIEKIVPIFREVTNEPEYQIYNMSSLDYEMPIKDREGTQLASRRASFSSLNPQPTQTAKQKNNIVEEEKVVPPNQSPPKPKVQILDSSTIGDKGLDSSEED